MAMRGILRERSDISHAIARERDTKYLKMARVLLDDLMEYGIMSQQVGIAAAGQMWEAG